MADIQHLILRTLDSAGDILDSVKFANERGIDHVKLTGQALSLESSEIIRKQDLKRSKIALSPEGKSYVIDGASPERQFYNAVPADGALVKDLQAKLGNIGRAGFPPAKQLGWVKLEKGKVSRAVSEEIIEDELVEVLKQVEAGQDLDAQTQNKLKRRKLIMVETWTTFNLSKGPKFALEKAEQAIILTAEMLQE